MASRWRGDVREDKTTKRNSSSKTVTMRMEMATKMTTMSPSMIHLQLKGWMTQTCKSAGSFLVKSIITTK